MTDIDTIRILEEIRDVKEQKMKLGVIRTLKEIRDSELVKTKLAYEKEIHETRVEALNWAIRVMEGE